MHKTLLPRAGGLLCLWTMNDAHKSKVFLWTLATFMIGIALASFVSVPPFVLLIAVIVGGVSSALGFAKENRPLKIYGILAIASIAGIARFDQALGSYQYMPVRTDQPVTFQGVIWEDPRHTISTQQLYMRVVSVNNEPMPRQFFLRVVSQPYPEYEVGEEIQFRGAVRDPADDQKDNRRQDPRMPGAVIFPEITTINSANHRPIQRALARVKYAFTANIEAVLQEPHAAFLSGILMGERASLPQSLTEQFRRTGTSHIVALSGYNITLVGKFFARACIIAAIPFYSSFWVAGIGMVIFVVMTGASASAVRAGIIALLVLVADREGRPYQMTNALAFAGAMMLLHDPLLLRFDVGFQLSFLATMGLVYGAPRLERWYDGVIDRMRSWSGKNAKTRLFENGEKNILQRTMAGAKKLFIETSAAQLAVLPLLIYLFGSVSLVSPVANIFVLAAVPYAMASGFIMGMIGWIAMWPAVIAGFATWALLAYILWTIGLLSSFPFATVFLGRESAMVLVGIYAIVWWRTRKNFEK